MPSMVTVVCADTMVDVSIKNKVMIFLMVVRGLVFCYSQCKGTKKSDTKVILIKKNNIKR